MSDSIPQRILSHLKSPAYRPQKPRRLARQLQMHSEENYASFRDALRELMHAGRVALGVGGNVVLPSVRLPHNEFIGVYHHKKGGFGFVVPTDPGSREDLFIPPGNNAGALSGDTVRARITSSANRGGRQLMEGRVIEVLERNNKRFVGALQKLHGQWIVVPDGNALTQPISVPDAASRHLKPGTVVVVELTQYPEDDAPAVGVITEVLGRAGEKDVDLKSIIVQYNLPEKFPEQVLAEARLAVDTFDPEAERRHRLDLSDQTIVTIDPPDAKDYDDAISLRRLDDGRWELGVHIADVSHFVPPGSSLDEEARQRGNSCYFPGFVIPMLPEILSNGVCSLQEGVPRLCKSVFITYDHDARPAGAKFANTIITSRKRLRYIEAQAIIDGAETIPHPDGDRRISDYEPEVVQLLKDMNALAKRLQRRRRAQGQLVLNLPEIELVLDEEGKVIGTREEDQSFTHTLIEMFMVEANEAAARLLERQGVPFLRRIHPEPELADAERLRHFVTVAGHHVPKNLDRKALQAILESVRGKPEEYAINLAVLKSLTRAEYSPENYGHYALASEAYAHFTSPIRRYADLTIHRLLDAYLKDRDAASGSKRRDDVFDDAPDHDELAQLGKHISFTERRAEDAERELRQVKILRLLEGHLGEVFDGVVTGITNFGIFVQIQQYLIDGLIRYEDLLDDWWDVDERAGKIRGQRTGIRIGIGDAVKVLVVQVDLPRRELQLAIAEAPRRGRDEEQAKSHRKEEKKKKHPRDIDKKHRARGGQAGNVRGGGKKASRRGGGRRR
jgi:ribonuclease R